MTTAQPQNNAVVSVFGRNYARFALEQRIHCVPVDDVSSATRSRAVLCSADTSVCQDEEQAYDAVNDIIRQLLGGTVRGVVLPRIRLTDAEILDCGYGKGAWIDAVLDLFPDATVSSDNSRGRQEYFLIAREHSRPQ